MSDYNSRTSMRAYYADRTTRQLARHISAEATLHDLAEIGLVDFFEGSGSDPTGLPGYASNKLWLRQYANVQDQAGDFLGWNGHTPVSDPANWVAATPSWFKSALPSLFVNVAFPPINTARAVGAATLAFQIVGAVNYRGLPQGMTIDEVNRHVYVYYGFDGVIERYDLDGPLPQQAGGTSATTTDIGHQSLAVEHLSDGSVRLWAPGVNDGYAFRFEWQDGVAPDDSAQYRLFDVVEVGENFINITISADQRYLLGVARAVSGSYTPTLVRVWRLSDLVTGGAGDYRESAIYEWTPDDEQFPVSPAGYPLQGWCSDGTYVYMLSGLGDGGYKPKLYTYHIATGEIVARTSDVEVGLAEAALLAGGDYNEPEALAIVAGDSGRPAIAALFAQGETSGERSNRIYILDRWTANNAERSWERLRAELPSTLTSPIRSFYKSIIDDLWGEDIFNKLAFLYWTASDSETTAKLNWVRPGWKTLTPVSSPVFTAWQGYVGDGVADYLDTGITPLHLPNFERNSAHVGVYITGNASGTNALGLNSGLSILLQTRTGGGNYSSRFQETTAANTANADGSGYYLLNRASSASYVKYKNNASVATVSNASSTLASSGTITLLNVNGSFSAAGAQISAAHAGLALDDGRRDAMSAIVTRWMTEAATF